MDEHIVVRYTRDPDLTPFGLIDNEIGCGSRFPCHDGQMAERDRDESGRPRSTRPRDALGRPLPHGSEGVLRIPDDLELPPAETLAYAQDLLDRGLAFNAHEVLEAAWKNGPDDERMLWQGLAQLAVPPAQRKAPCSAARRPDLPRTTDRRHTPSTPPIWSPTPMR